LPARPWSSCISRAKYVLYFKQTSYQLPSNTTAYVVILVLMATYVYFGTTDHHVANLQELNLVTLSCCKIAKQWSEGPKHVAIRTRVTKYIVFDGNC
jgi:hypothetical protein